PPAPRERLSAITVPPSRRSRKTHREKTSRVTAGVTSLLDESQGMGAVVRVRGTDGRAYYRERDPNTGEWTNWHLR
ncbi:hypothetical protein, partial [Streptomyces sp. NPDC059928]|uniref:hypothetical protein n=1 Tax=unclassified Streptomyces TaxID=2593676 RepID=UPI0036490237